MLLAGRALGSTLRQACNVARKEFMSTACGPAERLAFCSSAQGQADGPNDGRNASGWSGLWPEEPLKRVQEKDGGPEGSNFLRVRVASGQKDSQLPTGRAPSDFQKGSAFPQHGVQLVD